MFQTLRQNIRQYQVLYKAIKPELLGIFWGIQTGRRIAGSGSPRYLSEAVFWLVEIHQERCDTGPTLISGFILPLPPPRPGPPGTTLTTIQSHWSEKKERFAF